MSTIARKQAHWIVIRVSHRSDLWIQRMVVDDSHLCFEVKRVVGGDFAGNFGAPGPGLRSWPWLALGSWGRLCDVQ